MLECGANFQMKYGGKLCKQCNIIDDEDHRLNNCPTFKDVNFYDTMEKIDFQMIYSDNLEESSKVIKAILAVWDLGCGKNVMRKG